MVNGRVPLSEVMKWDLEDIEAYHAVKAMHSDHESAHREFQEQESKNNRKE